MAQVKKYYFQPTALIPNSSQPLLHYPGYFAHSKLTPVNVYDTFLSNGWELQWIFRYGPNQKSHYHSAVHECMAVLTGTATIRFGVADTICERDEVANTDGTEDGGIEIMAHAGDVFVIPAGLAHKTYNTQPAATLQLLTRGDGHNVGGSDPRQTLAEVQLSGFTMLGAYPVNSTGWDFAIGGDHIGHYEQVWSIPKPERDPVLGSGLDGVAGQWT